MKRQLLIEPKRRTAILHTEISPRNKFPGGVAEECKDCERVQH